MTSFEKYKESRPVRKVTDYVLKVGSVQVTADGSGLWGASEGLSREVAVELEVTVMEDGYKLGTLNGSHDETDSLFYTDKAVLEQVKALLREKGLDSDVEWSEQGMQDYTVLNMDVDNVLMDEVLTHPFTKVSSREV